MARYTTDGDGRILDSDGALVANHSNIAQSELECRSLNSQHDFATAHPHPAFSQIVAKAAEIGWPTSYHRDLSHWDAYHLALSWRDNPDDAAAWAIGPNGTHLVFPFKPDAVNHPASIARHIAKLWPECRWFWIDDDMIRECTADKAAERLDIIVRSRARKAS